MNVDHTRVQFGVKVRSRLAAYLILLILPGCSPALFVELRNGTGTVIYAEDFKRGSIAIPSGARALVDMPGGQLMINTPEKRIFDLKHVPSAHVHTTRRGLVVYAVLKEDALYLATKTRDGNLQLLDPQPAGFPLKASHRKSE